MIKLSDLQKRMVESQNKRQTLKVQNLGGTAGKECECEGWEEHWENGTGKLINNHGCSVLGCQRGDLVGGHVIMTNSDDKKHYIIPLCRYHNGQPARTVFDIYLGTEKVSANVSETCGKRR